MSNLQFKNINKIYDNNVQAVFDFNLEIKDKEFIVFVGPSGCGKSTTLRMVAGLEDITAGELYIDNILVNNIAPKNRNIAMVFQNYALYPHMSVYGNIAFALKIRKFRLPVFTTNAEIEKLELDNTIIYKEIKSLYKKIKSGQRDKEVVNQLNEKHKEIDANLDKINKLRKPVIGIDSNQIAELEKNLLSAKKSLAQYEMHFQKGGYTESASKLLKEGIEQKKKLISIISEQIEHLKVTPIELTELRKYSRVEIDSEIYKAAKILDLEEYLFRKPAALSGGQRQRVALARCIARKPKVFLMDEPLSNLDAKLRVQTRSEISRIHKNVCATTIYVTHDQVEAMTMADRIVVMKDGWIQQIGTPKELFNNPANKFVASFIGSPGMNFIEGTFNKDSIDIIDEETKTKFSYKLPESIISKLNKYNGKKVIMGIRPEDIYFDQNVSNAMQGLDINVDYTELLGYDLMVYSKVLGNKIVAKIDEKSSLKIGSTAKIYFDEKRLHLFDGETELKIQ